MSVKIERDGIKRIEVLDDDDGSVFLDIGLDPRDHLYTDDLHILLRVGRKRLSFDYAEIRDFANALLELADQVEGK